MATSSGVMIAYCCRGRGMSLSPMTLLNNLNMSLILFLYAPVGLVNPAPITRAGELAAWQFIEFFNKCT